MKTILVPLSRREQADFLDAFILPVAQSEKANVILLHLCLVHHSNDEQICAQQALSDTHWLQDAARIFKDAGVAVQIVRREAHSIAGGIRETVRELLPDLLALIWHKHGRASALATPNMTLRDLLMDVPCDLVVWRGDNTAPPPHRVLIPSAGGPNAELGFHFAQDFHRVYGSKLLLLRVLPLAASDDEMDAAREGIEQWAEEILQELALPPQAVETHIIRAASPTAGILQMASPDHSDVVIMGASREGVINRIRFGEIPERVAARARVPVLIIKRPLPRRITIFRRMWDAMASLTPALSDSEKVEVYREARRSARLTRDFLTMITLSTAIATLGLVLNAPAVIIGAMLIAPLMNAIIGMGLGVVQGDMRMLAMSAKTTLAGVGVTLLVSFVLEALIPFDALTPEMLARSAPNLLDLGVALFAGAAGAYALARKNVSSSLPGVAIAVALIPPLATSGMALGLGAWGVALGAGLLFLTNIVGIVAMSSWLFLTMGFKPKMTRMERMRVFSRGWQAIFVMILLVVIPLGMVTARQLQRERVDAAVELTLQDEFSRMSDVRLTDWQYHDNGHYLAIELQIETRSPLSSAQAQDMQARLAQRLHKPVALTLKTIPTLHLAPQP